MKKNLLLVLTLLLVISIAGVSLPNSAVAASTVQYQPRTTQELIAYLYGRIVQLQEIQKLLQSGSAYQSDTFLSFDSMSVNTKKADAVTDVTAYLRGEVVLFGKTTATAWFEYGQDEDFLDFKSRKITVRSAYDRAIRVQVTNLEEDKRYYFRLVAQDNKGNISYSSTFAFRTDEANN